MSMTEPQQMPLTDESWAGQPFTVGYAETPLWRLTVAARQFGCTIEEIRQVADLLETEGWDPFA